MHPPQIDSLTLVSFLSSCDQSEITLHMEYTVAGSAYLSLGLGPGAAVVTPGDLQT